MNKRLFKRAVKSAQYARFEHKLSVFMHVLRMPNKDRHITSEVWKNPCNKNCQCGVE